MRLNAMDRHYLKGNGWIEVFDGSFVTVDDGWHFELIPETLLDIPALKTDSYSE